MYFVRKFGSGLNTISSDPRDKIFAEYKCALCGKTSEIDITRVTESFDINRERRCPKCGQISADDKRKNLVAQIEKLTSDKSSIEVQIDKLTRELEEIPVSSDNS